MFVENYFERKEDSGVWFGMVSDKGFIHYNAFLLDILYSLRHNFEIRDLSEGRHTHFFM
jgi:hypothetical protein